MEQDTSTLWDWISTTGLQIGLILLAVFVTHRFGHMIVRRAVRRALRSHRYATKQEEVKREDTLVRILMTALHIGLWIIAALMILDVLGVDTTPLLAGASIVGVALGFGAQSLVKDMIAGLFIIIENQYRVGDVVELEGVGGTVQDLGLRSTVLRDMDGNVHHIPNGIITIATNQSNEFSRINLNMTVGQKADIKKVEEVINQVGKDMAKDKEWTDVIKETPKFLRIDNFNELGVIVKIVGTVTAGKQWEITGELRMRLKNAFEAAGIEIPFSQFVMQADKSAGHKPKPRQ